ncbi:MAG TPA: rhodanese-like domain-containing protein, partial [Chloroflexia bacterium]|nr:rhodanese-like domain-containing protein [Chloroflexia bacterium]
VTVRRVPTQPYVNPPQPPKRDIFPYVMGGLIAALVVGIGLIIFLLGSGSGRAGDTVNNVANLPPQVPTAGGSIVSIPQAQATGASNAGQTVESAATTVPTPAGDAVKTVVPTIPVGQREEDVPRIAMDDFKTLYDDTAKRPVIIDVRSKDAYDLGHIRGSISFPEADIAARIKELPKDKLVVAYCA